MKHRGLCLTPVVGCTAAIAALLLTGCGGGGSASGGSAPTATTRARVHAMSQNGMRSLTLSGVQTPFYASLRNGGLATGVGASGGASVPAASSTALPMVGAFLKNIAAVPPATRAAHLQSRGVALGRQVVDPLPPISLPTFYYDDYLGLWVQIEDDPESSTYLLYADEAKTQPAGSIRTTWPVDWNTYPQVYASTYRFTAGFLAGAHGDYSDTVGADGSGASTYEDTYPDGSRDAGTSIWRADGSSEWSSRSDNADGSWFECSGSFLADGSGKTHERSSDGYGADYVYNADYSGSAVLTGPDPGLPAKIVWDSYGNETITYADGTVETVPMWIGYADGSPGSTGDGSTSDGDGNSPPPPPSPVPTAIPLTTTP